MSDDFFQLISQILGPFATGRLLIDESELIKLSENSENRASYIKTNGTGDLKKIRGAHIDGPGTVFTFLLYLKLPNDFSVGADLHLLMEEKSSGIRGFLGYIRGQLKLIKTVEYKANTLLIFLNGTDSWHDISPRKNAKITRMSIQGGLTSDKKVYRFTPAK